LVEEEKLRSNFEKRNNSLNGDSKVPCCELSEIPSDQIGYVNHIM
jgi:hypothetical protein